MSAHTFETLSIELTRALAEQAATPPGTIARCTLGRDKVMVLIEYPLDSASAEPTSKQTLSWLEAYLREQFDTAGLPDEAADLSEEIEEVPVQLYLKHMSEARPFTMQSFTWKVADGFDDIFGESTLAFTPPPPEEASPSTSPSSVSPSTDTSHPATDSAPANPISVDLASADQVPTLEMPSAAIPTSIQPVSSISETTIPAADQPMDNTVVSPESVVMLPEGEEERVLLELESNLSLDLETDVDVLDTDLDSDLRNDFGEDDFGFESEMTAGIDSEDEISSSADLDLGLELGLGSAPTLIPDPEINSSDALEADLSLGLQPSGRVVPDSNTEFSLPGEAPTIESSEFELPTVDLPLADTSSTKTEKSIDFFELRNNSSEIPTADPTAETGITDLFELSPLDALITENAELEAITQPNQETLEEEPELKTLELETLKLEVPGLEISEPEIPEPKTLAPEKIEFEAPETEIIEEPEPELETIELETLDLENIASVTNTIETTTSEADVSESSNAEKDFELESDTTEGTEIIDPLDAFLSTGAAYPESEDITLINETSTVENSKTVIEESEIDDSIESSWDTSDDLIPDNLADLSIEAAKAEVEEATDTSDINTIETTTLDNRETDNQNNDLEVNESSKESWIVQDSISQNEPVQEEVEQDSLENRDQLESELEDELESELEAEPEYASEDAPESELETESSAESSGSAIEIEEVLEAEEEDYDLYDYEISDGETGSTEEEYTEDEDSAYYLEGEEGEEARVGDYEEVALVDDVEVQRQRDQWKQQSKGNPLVIVGAFGFVLAGVLGYVFTRPCTVGSCDRIETAQEKGTEAISSLSAASTAAEVTDSKKELEHAIQMLEPIPVWSSHYDDAQATLPKYQQQLSELDLVTAAQAEAYSAAVKSQDPPHPASTWEEVAEQWREATSLLSQVSLDSPVRGIAERKLIEYRANLSTILVRIEAEAGAEVSLRQAQVASERATQLTKQANSLEGWEEVLFEWATAVENLRRIPQGSQAYEVAKGLIPEYEEKLLEARTRVEQEQSARRILLRAEDFSTQAKVAEREDQWTTAVENWSQAVFQLGEIPESSLAYSDAQSRLVTYTGALGAAENNMQVSLRFAPMEPSFYLICGGSELQKCTYSITAGKVRMDLAEGYDTVINESITPPPQRTVINPSTQLVSQSNQLLQQITLLSTQAQIPVELYDSEGAFLARYRPDLDGFVRQ